MSATNTVVQRTSFGRIADEEQGFPDTRSNTRTSELQPKLEPDSEAGGKRKIGFVESLKAIAFSSWLNLLLLFIPIAWVAHFGNEHDAKEGDAEKTWKFQGTFVLCFLAIIPLEKLFDYGGEQMAFYLGEDLGDLLVVTLNNTVEATLAIILLKKCELKVCVVLLHLLLIPGVAFVTGGARVLEQDLHPHLTQLNHTLLTIGVMTLLLPAAFFAALNHGSSAAPEAESFINDTNRHVFLQMSRGLAVILLTVYICSRIFLHNPPGENFELSQHKLAPEALKERAIEIQNAEPEVNQWVCIGMLILVDSIEFVRESGGMKPEWFGLVLLPLVSFSGDGFLAIVFFFRSWLRWIKGQRPPPATLANARPIDLSIQFIMFWMPFITLLGWWMGNPMSLLFEVALIISSCFIVNYVTADSKTNWAEGYAMLAFYGMALCSWFYDGQKDIEFLLQCEGIEEAIAKGLEPLLE
ncbi:hypothetical protein B0H14DRAFT_2720106 [Mycena olivaceomarginata]|nr:hypothetical protein B0H14DRAFT_2720106 [Mycena olivaceomarginata]